MQAAPHTEQSGEGCQSAKACGWRTTICKQPFNSQLGSNPVDNHQPCPPSSLAPPTDQRHPSFRVCTSKHKAHSRPYPRPPLLPCPPLFLAFAPDLPLLLHMHLRDAVGADEATSTMLELTPDPCFPSILPSSPTPSPLPSASYAPGGCRWNTCTCLPLIPGPSFPLHPPSPPYPSLLHTHLRDADGAHSNLDELLARVVGRQHHLQTARTGSTDQELMVLVVWL